MILPLIGVTVALGGKLLDRLFGKEEPFEFKGSTAPAHLKGLDDG